MYTSTKSGIRLRRVDKRQLNPLRLSIYSVENKTKNSPVLCALKTAISSRSAEDHLPEQCAMKTITPEHLEGNGANLMSMFYQYYSILRIKLRSQLRSACVLLSLTRLPKVGQSCYDLCAEKMEAPEVFSGPLLELCRLCIGTLFEDLLMSFERTKYLVLDVLWIF